VAKFAGKYRESKNSIAVFKSHVYKKVSLKLRRGRPLDQAWFNNYNTLAKTNKHLPKLLSLISDTEFTMEKVDIKEDLETYFRHSTSPYGKKFFSEGSELKVVCEHNDMQIKILDAFNTCWIQGLRYSQENRQSKISFFVHGDMSLRNFVITKQNNIMLLDPDAYSWQGNYIFAKHFAQYTQLYGNVIKNMA